MRVWFAALSMLCAIGAAIALASLAPKTPSPAPADVEPTSADIESTNVATIESEVVDQTPPKLSVQQQSLRFELWPAELDESSWQDPFESRHWDLQGWEVDGESLSGQDVAKTNAAMFRKRYSKLMLEFDAVPLGDGGSLSIRCYKTEDTRQHFDVRLRHDQIDVIESNASLTKHNVAFSELDEPSSFKRDRPSQVKVMLTGNRLLVHLNGKRIINCPQPMLGTSPEFVFQFHAAENVWRIPKLRIEGE